MRNWLLIFLFLICTFFCYSNGTANKSRQQIVRELFDSVEEWMGTPYVYGGNSKNGIDCSAFVSRVYSKVFNVKLPRTVAYQKNLGTAVTGNLQPGDLIFFDFGSGISHVGIFVFGEKFIHAASGGPSVGVVKCSLKEPFIYLLNSISLNPYCSIKKPSTISNLDLSIPAHITSLILDSIILTSSLFESNFSHICSSFRRIPGILFLYFRINQKKEHYL